MATLTIITDTRGKSGSTLLRLRIAHLGTQAYISTQVKIDPAHFTGNLYAPISPKSPHYRMGTEQVVSIVRKYDEVIFDLERDGLLDTLTANDIRDYIVGKRKADASFVSFSQYLAKYGQKCRSDKYRETFVYTSNILTQFCKETKKRAELLFQDVDYQFLRDLEMWMESQGKGISTRGIVFRNMRAAYSEAMKSGIVSFESYPFRLFSIKSRQQAEIEYLTFDQMRQVLTFDLSEVEERGSTITRARDIFLISFYLCGMNLRDIYDLPPQTGNEVVYVRSKIAHREPKPTRIRIEPELQVLIDKYRGEKHLFNFAEESYRFETFKHNLNQRMRRLSSLMGIRVHTAIARHTWATLCSQLGIEEYVISKSLGHMDSTVTTRHYIEYDWGRTAAANRAVIDAILANGSSPTV